MGIPALSRSQLGDLGRFGVGLDRSTPLWFYILREAEINGGNRLGPLGSRILSEVFIALLWGSQWSILRERNAHASPWAPGLPSRDAATFKMPDLLRFVDNLSPLG